MVNFQKTFKDYINEKQLVDINSCKHIVAGISGGKDSVCLLLLLKDTFENTGVKITAVHVNHNLRAEAKADEAFVRDLCRRLNIDLKVFSEDVKGLAEMEGLGLEEAGRKIRYAGFIKTAQELSEGLPENSTKIAVAHHLNDCVETVIFNLIRGSNLAGLAGILPRQTLEGFEIIRPLLFAREEEILGYLREKKQDFVTDSTNMDTDFTRNKIRHGIIPKMKEINSSAVDHIARASEAAGEAEEFLKRETDKLYEKAVKVIGGEYFIDTEILRNAEKIISRRIIYRAIGEINGSLKDVSNIHVENSLSLMNCESGKRVSLSGGVTAVKEGRDIVLKKEKQNPENINIIISRQELKDGLVKELANGIRISFRVFETKDGNIDEIIKKNQYTKTFDYDKIAGSIFLGTRTGDERIRLQQGEKSLSRFFIDQRIPRDRRDDYLILKEGQEVIWVVGLRISEKYKITNTTKRVLEVCIVGGFYG